LGDETPNTQREYLTNRTSAHGDIFKKRGEPAVFIVNPMEVEEAAKSGLIVKTRHDFGWDALSKQHKGDAEAIQRGLFKNIFETLGISGKVGLYGAAEVNYIVSLAMMLMDSTLNIQIVAGGDSSKLFAKMYETKDDQEIMWLREAGVLTSQLVRDTQAFISEHYAASLEIGTPITDADGKPLTIGRVKQFIKQRATELGLNEEDTIFAQGRDAGFPHSRGEPDDVLEVGRSIVYDIFPRKTDTGYFHDMTRTWCIGVAPADVQAAYDDVMHVFKQTREGFKKAEDNKSFQIMALDYFESKGHPTHRSAPGTMDGYVHSLGHGLGLNIHEAPGFGLYSASKLTEGNVFTVEPGLYYPDRGYGVRVEDTVYLDETGCHTLTDAPYDLVIPIKQK
jgi:Xaa-Pro aminopeptidase